MIKQSDIVRYSESFCQMIRADSEIADGLALVLEEKNPSKKKKKKKKKKNKTIKL